MEELWLELLTLKKAATFTITSAKEVGKNTLKRSTLDAKVPGSCPG